MEQPCSGVLMHGGGYMAGRCGVMECVYSVRVFVVSIIVAVSKVSKQGISEMIRLVIVV